MKQKFRLVLRSVMICAVCVILPLVQTACTPQQLDSFKRDSKFAVAEAVAVQALLNGYVAQGKISSEIAAFIQTRVAQGITLVSNLNDRVQKLDKWPPESPQEIIGLIKTALDFIQQSQTEAS